MRGDLTTPRHGTGQIDGWKGLLTNIPDLRAAAPGYLRRAENVVFDELGNARPRDGSAQYWAPISQRTYLAEMEPAENSTWTNGAVETTTIKYGFQSRVQAASSTMTRALPAAIDLYIGGKYTAANTYINAWFRTTALANITSISLQIASDVGFANSESWGISVGVGQNIEADATWTLVTKQLGTGTIAGTPNYAAITHMRIVLSLAGACSLFTDEVYTSHTNYMHSWCTGQVQFRKISSQNRYHLAVFGETLYADLNEAQSPYKVKSGLTRNYPAYFETFEDRCAMFNGTDTPLVFTGTTYRTIGYAVPTTDPSLASAGGGGSVAAGDYYYGVTFVYGEGAVVHGESSMKQKSTGVTAVATDIINVTSIPVGIVGSGVIKRRIYRSRVNAGPNATKYFVAEIADNTTTTYNDSFADTSIIVNAEGPTDNGIPPVAKIGRWFQKGMVYLTNTAIYWSRPGTNLNETPETVPAINQINLGNAGENVGAIEFNQRLYIFHKRGIGKVFWRGSNLDYEPVQRAGDSNSQAIGAYDQNAITVVSDRYILWQDAEGQHWKMLPNEEIFPESRNIANTLNDFNNLPVTSTLDHYTTDNEAQWELGTVGANLSTDVVSGKLSYRDRLAAPWASPVGPTQTFSPTWSTAAAAYPANIYSQVGGTLRSLSGTFDLYWTLQATASAVKITHFSILLGGSAAGTVSATLVMYKYSYETGLMSAASSGINSTGGGVAISSQTLTFGGQTFSGLFGTATFSTGNVFIPKGEKVVFRITISGGPATVSFPITTDQYMSNILNLYQSGFYQTVNGPGSGQDAGALAYRPYFVITGSNAQAATTVGSTIDATTALQRWHWMTTASTIALKAGKSLKVELETSSDEVAWYNRQEVYSLEYRPGALSAVSPLVEEKYTFYPRRDYRVGAAFPAGTQWRYGRFRVTIDPNQGQSPIATTYSGVGTTESAVFPVLVDPKMLVSGQASFATYDKTNYTRDIYTSETIDGVSIGSWGNFHAEYREEQQLLSFQIQTSATTTFAATWYDVTPGSTPPANSIVSSARYFRYRIIFQDDPLLENGGGEPSFVDEVKVSWAQASAQVAPYMPSVLTFYKDYIYGSWASRGSRVHNRSLAVDAYKVTYEDVPHRYSTFTAPHYVSYANVQGQLIGAPSSGGTLSKLRNSEIADLNSGAVVSNYTGVLELHPWSMGTYNLKSLYWLYLGMQLGVYKYGHYLGEPGVYPTISGYPLHPWFIITAADSSKSQAFLNLVGPGAPAYGPGFTVPGIRNLVQMRTIMSHSLSSADANGLSIKPYTTEYGVQCALQERAFSFGIQMTAMKDSSGNAYFPICTGLGTEFHVENSRGV